MSWVQLSDQAAPHSLRCELQTGNTWSLTQQRPMRPDEGHKGWSSLGDSLDPAECLLDALADGITAVPGRLPVTTLLRPLVFSATRGIRSSSAAH
jgi:hypothetical protein